LHKTQILFILLYPILLTLSQLERKHTFIYDEGNFIVGIKRKNDKMSLQLLNEEFQIELEAERQAPKMTNPIRGVVQRLRTTSLGSTLRGEYPSSNRLEEILVSYD
jgi:hypothetical protein